LVDGVKIASKETGCEVTDWTYSASDMDKWQAFLNTASISSLAEKLLTDNA
jgi:hypothetical protein